MNMTIEKFKPLHEITTLLQEASILRGDPAGLIENCEKLTWDKPARLWTFRTEDKPPAEKLEAFMDRFEIVFPVHERDGNYRAAWWSTTEAGSDQFIIKGLFTDLNPVTGPDFFKRAADGPRIAFWFGRIQKILSDSETEYNHPEP